MIGVSALDAVRRGHWMCRRWRCEHSPSAVGILDQAAEPSVEGRRHSAQRGISSARRCMMCRLCARVGCLLHVIDAIHEDSDELERDIRVVAHSCLKRSRSEDDPAAVRFCDRVDRVRGPRQE